VISVADCNPNDNANTTTPLRAGVSRHKEKMARYVDNWDVAPAQVVPIIFETYGGSPRDTWAFLYEAIGGIAGDDRVLHAELYRNLRGKVSTALWGGTAEAIMRNNTHNTTLLPSDPPTSPRVPPRPRSRTPLGAFSPAPSRVSSPDPSALGEHASAGSPELSPFASNHSDPDAASVASTPESFDALHLRYSQDSMSNETRQAAKAWANVSSTPSSSSSSSAPPSVGVLPEPLNRGKRISRAKTPKGLRAHAERISRVIAS